MPPKNALELLFEYNFGNGPLFKNQIDLVNELINDHQSSYYTDSNDEVEYAKAMNRRKAYISQLLSESARRFVTPSFHESLRVLIKKRLLATSHDADEITELIVADLKERNKKEPLSNFFPGSRRGSTASELIKDIIAAKYIAVFTVREISFEYEIFEKRISFVNLLIENLVDTIKRKQQLKYYRFNFPLEQTCHLFWRGLRKEITKHLKSNKDILPDLLIHIKTLFNHEIEFKSDPNKDGEFEDQVTVQFLDYLSRAGTINVFHLKAPIYIVPFVAINPNETNRASSYIFLQSLQEYDNIHKLTKEEQVHMKFFVWDNMKKNKAGLPIKFSADF
jgi:hypothetical protein